MSDWWQGYILGLWTPYMVTAGVVFLWWLVRREELIGDE